jgi:hypothetical protein
MARALVKLLELVEHVWGPSGELEKAEAELQKTPKTAVIKSYLEIIATELRRVYRFDDFTPPGSLL